MKLDRAAVYVEDRTGLTFSSETLRRIETDAIPDDKINPLVLGALLDIYGRRVGELPEPLRVRIERASDLLTALGRCSRAYADQLAMELVA